TRKRWLTCCGAGERRPQQLVLRVRREHDRSPLLASVPDVCDGRTIGKAPFLNTTDEHRPHPPPRGGPRISFLRPRVAGWRSGFICGYPIGDSTPHTRRRSMRLAVIALLAALIAPASFAQSTPSVGEDFKKAGRDVEDGVKEGYDKTKDATLHGVGN